MSAMNYSTIHCVHLVQVISIANKFKNIMIAIGDIICIFGGRFTLDNSEYNKYISSERFHVFSVPLK